MVPIRLDLFTVIIFLGAVQGLFLSLFFFIKRNDSALANRLLGLLVLTLSAFSIDIFLGYSGYMARVLHSVDSTEALNFVVGPLIFLYIVVAIDRQDRLRPSQYLHFIPALFYAVYFLLFFFQSTDYKYNAYIDAYYPELPMRDAPAAWVVDPLKIKKNISLLQIIHIGIYFVLSLRYYFPWSRHERRAGVKNQESIYSWMRVMYWGLGLSYIALIVIKSLFERDLGEYLIASKTALLIYAFSFYVISKSAFFTEHQPKQKAKYKKSLLPADHTDRALANLHELMTTEKPYLDPRFSLRSLAEKLNLTTHQVSQLINAHRHQSFYEMTASYRIKDAQAMLSDPQHRDITIEQLAFEVGYYAKSSFNTAFKKQTGMTPSAFRDSVQPAAKTVDR